MDSTPKLAAALVKAQAVMQDAKKDSTNPHFKSKYADLASIVAVLREPLAKNGLGFIQDVKSDKDGVSIRTTLVHESGEKLAGEWLFLPVVQQTPQAYGSAVTYGKRYSLAALVGVVADEDDDGNAASVVKPRAPAKPPPMTAKEAIESPKYKGRLLTEMEDLELKEAARALVTWLKEPKNENSKARQPTLDLHAKMLREMEERDIRHAENAPHH